jgi:4-amino-4-deoxy-L-arabinose transferase-like glycosyltransferase
VCALSAAAVIFVLRKVVPDNEIYRFVSNVFLGALLVRALLASVIHGFELQMSFGPDALTYDHMGNVLATLWIEGGQSFDLRHDVSGWGMTYIVGATYYFIGRNPFAVQLLVSFFGALTSTLTFFCSQEIFRNNRVAKFAAFFVAFFPAMVIWTSQLLKEGFIIFCLVLALFATLRLLEKFRIDWIIYILIAMLGIFSLRFYVFFILAGAVIGGLILGAKATPQGLVYRFVICSVIGAALSLLGVGQLSQQQADKYVSMERLQVTRSYAASAANSGLDIEEEDVSTTSGLLTALPYGLLILFLAPFPWQVQSLTQVLTMPEMIIWWISLPFLFAGVVYTVRHRFRQCASILFFTLMLSLSYAVYQGNLGTLYRQRAQIQVFLLIFTAVGVTIALEKKENAKLKKRYGQMAQKMSPAK